jgi:hypothetical protein
MAKKFIELLRPIPTTMTNARLKEGDAHLDSWQIL